RLVALRSIQRFVLVRRVLHTVCAHTAALRPEPPGGAPLSLALEHCLAGKFAVLFPVYPHRYHHPDSAVAGHSRLRSRSDRAGCDLERRSSVVDYVYGWAPDASQTRPSSVAGCRPGLHRLGGLLERPVHDGLVGRELLPHRVAHGRRAIGISHRAGGMHHPAGSLYGGIGETSMDPDIFRDVSYDPLVWWNRGRHLHGTLSR